MRALVFDLDGVLIDSEPLWARVLDDALRARGSRYDTGIARRHLGMRLADVVAILRDGHALDVDATEFAAEIVRRLRDEFDARLAPMPGAAEALAWAHESGLRLGLASSSPLAVIRPALARFDWERRFAAVCSGDEVARGKPAPDLYLLAARRLGLPAAQCVAVEDSPHGVRASRAAGMRCLAVEPVDEADEVIDGVGRLPEARLARLPGPANDL